MASRRVLVLAMLIASTCLQAQPDTGTTWDAFGPDRASGVFVNITRRHLINEYAYGITVDDKNRLLVLNSWREDGNSNSDCAVTRHINNARMLDMSYTGPDDLEGTRRVAADMGSINADTCTSIDADTDGSGHGFVDQVDLLGTGVFAAVLHRALLHFGDAAGDADHHPQVGGE